MEPPVSLSPEVPGIDLQKTYKLPLQYYYAKVRIPCLLMSTSFSSSISSIFDQTRHHQTRFEAGNLRNSFFFGSSLTFPRFLLQQVIGMKDKKPVFMKKVIAVYPKGIKVAHATTESRTVKELEVTNLLKFVDIREFQYLPEKSIFRFSYRAMPSNDPLPLATDLQYEFELALVGELNRTIDEALNRLAQRRKRNKRKRSQSLTQSAPPVLSHAPIHNSSEAHTTSSTMEEM